ncbi:hypothetical protein R83H12_01456 [Fibrobacteria bacterium R8-3-H12]
MRRCLPAGGCVFLYIHIMIYQITLDVQENKISLVEELFRSISFIKEVKPLDFQIERAKPNKFNAMRIKTKDFKFNREEANER